MTTQTTSAQHVLFLGAWEAAPKIPFNPEWNNGTSYFDFACDHEGLNLKLGEVVASTSEGANNRKILIKGLGDGVNAVIFERFTAGENGVICSNLPGRLTLKTLNLVGKPMPDLGHTSLTLGHVENFLSFKG